jgi:hypothetical protein
MVIEVFVVSVSLRKSRDLSHNRRHPPNNLVIRCYAIWEGTEQLKASLDKLKRMRWTAKVTQMKAVRSAYKRLF